MPDPSTCPRCNRPARYLSGRLFVCSTCGVTELPTDRKLRLICTSCGYALTGNLSGTCPECATPLTVGQRGALGQLTALKPRHQLLQSINRFEHAWAARSTHDNRCSKCDYPVAQLTHPRCPECGTLVHAHTRFAVVVHSLVTRVDAIEATDLNRLDAIIAVLPDHPSLATPIRLLARSGWPPLRAARTVLDAFTAADSDELNDDVARAILPRGKTAVGLYNKLRELGHAPAAALAEIVPHARSYAAWLNAE